MDEAAGHGVHFLQIKGLCGMFYLRNINQSRIFISADIDLINGARFYQFLPNFPLLLVFCIELKV